MADIERKFREHTIVAIKFWRVVCSGAPNYPASIVTVFTFSDPAAWLKSAREWACIDGRRVKQARL
ncbi:MAG TPA: hypothetical protein VNE38_12790 [Ktedonobacteraceae bacterium]|nr:hypothetical protein [Ktedonobacteraceae bacterium]